MDSFFTWIGNMLCQIVMIFEGIVYQLASYSYKIFSLMCQLNFNSLYVIMAPLLDRFRAVIIVLVLYNVATALIKLMMNPENAPTEGTKIIKNIAITVALLLGYNLIFSVMNELSMLVLGTPEGYTYTVLNDLAEVTGGEDEGLIMRFVFGENKDIGEVGDFVVYSAMSVFVQNTTESDEVGAALADGDNINFMNLSKLAPKIGKTISYFPLVGLVLGGFLVYTFFNLAAEVGIRMFKLLVLQLIAPLAIITIVYKGWEGSLLKTKYIPCYISVLTSIFIRIASTFIVTVFISKFVQNIGTFFTGIQWGDEWYTSGLVLAIIIFAGYKFVLEIPKFLEEAIGAKISGFGKSDGFASVLGGALVGGATGLITGVAGGIASARHSGRGALGSIWNGATSAIAGGAMGLTQGAFNGTKGNGIAEKIKNGYGVRNKVRDRSNRWYADGGVLPAAGHSIVKGTSEFFGAPQRQDRMMSIYDEQENAIKAYEDAINQAQIDAIKGTTMSTSEEMVIGRDKDGSAVKMSTSDIYSSGYENVKLGDSASSYVQKMLEYDREYQQTQAVLEAAKSSGDATAIANAQRKNIEAKNEATKRASEYWESKKSSATYSDDKISKQRAAANRSLSRNGTRREETDAIDITQEKRNIEANRNELQGRRSYRHTHRK